MSHQLIANLPDNKPHLLFGDSHVRVMPRGDKACFLPRAAVHKMKAKTSRLGSSPKKEGGRVPRSDETRLRGNKGARRACAVVSLYQKQLVHEDARDVLVDVLTELRGYCKAHGWDFQYAVRRSLQEHNAELGNAAWFVQFLEQSPARQ